MKTKLSIIIPVYNGERCLKTSLESIKCRKPENVELVFVNDGSTDKTVEILDNYQKDSFFCCKIIHQANQGVAAARNAALEAAGGEFLVFLDADDQLNDGAIDKVLSMTCSQADIIGWDWISQMDGKNRPMRQAPYQSPEQALKNMMGGTMKWNLWLFAIKRALVTHNNIHFVQGADMGEDMAFMLKAFSCAKEVKQFHEPIYCYNAANPASISLQLNESRRAEVSRNLESVAAFLQTSPYAETCRRYLPHLKLFIKRPLLIGFSFDNYRLWHQWLPEANFYAMKNDALPLRVRILQRMAADRLWLGVWAYNLLYRLFRRFLYW